MQIFISSTGVGKCSWNKLWTNQGIRGPQNSRGGLWPPQSWPRVPGLERSSSNTF